ncbi:MAG: L-histidine N(alpha)-methyltransferase [Bacteroidota bacterium]
MPTPPATASPQRETRNEKLETEREAFLRDVIAGLSASPKSLPCKYFYDEIGSVLFDQITETEEYYPTRMELAIMQAHVDEMAAQIGPGAVLVEYGSGSSLKTRVLLDHLGSLAAYVPIDISGEHLFSVAEQLRAAYPDLPILPVAADYTAAFDLPDLPAGKRVVYFPGSTIGNFDEAQAAAFLDQAARIAEPGGGLLIGVDLKKDPAVLEAAYDDAAGVTSAFNLNLLDRINRELGGTFDRDRFAHRAVWNEDKSRIETYLVSLRDQTVEVDGKTFRFGEDEAMHTENSHKYTVEGFAAFAARHGLAVRQCWTDPADLFSVQYFEVGA